MRWPAASRWRWPVLLLLAAAVAAAVFAWIRLDTPVPERFDRYSRASFDRWLVEDPTHATQFKEFQRYLAANGVAEVVPAWQLTRTDKTPIVGCSRPAFLLPPREEWGNVVPVLRLVGKHVVPRLGPVEVVSSYRTPAFNSCVGGASRSRHLGFAAVDLVARNQPDKREMFRRLCALQRELGPASKFGLGAYFDPAAPGPSSGRFHVDASGFRSWGYSKRADSSGCRLLMN